MTVTVRDILQDMYERHGKLTPEIVLEETRAEDHALHHLVFDRAPDDAAESWYLHKARTLIKSVRIAYKDSGDGPKTIRAFHAVRSADTRGYEYKPAEEVALDDFTRQALLRDMEREWKVMKERYAKFKEFADMVREDMTGENAA